jgi:hypothetical protein
LIIYNVKAHPGNISAKFGSNLSSGMWEKDGDSNICNFLCYYGCSNVYFISMT